MNTPLNSVFVCVLFLVRPVATIDPKSTTNVNIGKSVIFTCKVYGFPKPQISWRKNGQEMGNNSRYTTNVYGNGPNLIWYSNLEIKTAVRNDTANYSCFLRNAAGTDIDGISLVVLGKDSFNYVMQQVTK